MPNHLLGIEGMSKEELLSLISSASSFVEISNRDVKKVPALRGKTIINLFLEPSTRTRTSFEIAAKRLSADAINITASGSSVSKGETLLDTARTLEAMSPNVLVVRHSESGAPHFLARYLKDTSVVNAGDGMHEHPTQALLDLLTLSQHFNKGIEGLKIAIVGDIRHSRVARSAIFAHKILGNEVRLVGPATLIPEELTVDGVFGGGAVKRYFSLSEGVEGVDVIMGLRMQLERQAGNYIPSLEEYTRSYCISERIFREYAPNAVFLHPGPVNRGTEVSSEVLGGPRSLVDKQVNNGVAVRMAVLFALVAKSSEEMGER